MDLAPYGTFGPVGAAHAALHPLMPVALVVCVALVVAFPRTWAAWGSCALALAARLAVGGPRPYMHADKAWYYLSEATGELAPDLRYGDGYASLMGLLQPITRGAGDHAFGVDLVLSSMTAGYAAGLAGRVEPRAAWAAGVIAALSPLSVVLGGSEIPFVAVTALQLAALYGVTGTRPAERLLGCGATILLAHLRPLQIVVCLPLLALSRRAGGPWWWAALAGWTWRVVELGGVLVTGASNGDGLAVHALVQWLDPLSWAGRQGRILLLDPWVEPLMCVPLAVLGARVAWERARELTAGALGIMALELALYGHQPLWPDRVRFLSPLVAWAAVFAGVGLVRAGRWWPGAVAALALTGWWASEPLAPEGVWMAENRFLRAHVADVRRGERVAFARGIDTVGVVRKWLVRSTGAWWEEATNQEPVGSLRFVGVADRLPGAPPVPWGRLAPIAEIEAPKVELGMVHLVGDEPVRIGLYRVVAPP